MKDLLFTLIILFVGIISANSSTAEENTNDVSVRLKITHPNGGEKLVPGSNFQITWEGCEVTDTVLIEYSTDAGESWNLITSTATGYNYYWTDIPQSFSDSCSMRIKLLTRNNTLQKPKVVGLGLINEFAVNPKNDRLLASCGRNGYIYLWDLDTKRVIDTIGDGKSSHYSVSFSPDGKMVAAGGSDSIVRIWDTETGVFLKSLIGHKDTVTSISFSHDGKKIASGSYDKTIMLWDVITGKCQDTLVGNLTRIRAIAFSPVEYLLISKCDDTLRIWDANTGRCIDSLYDHPHYRYALGFTRDGKKYYSLGGDKYFTLGVRLWDASSRICLDSIRYWSDLASLSISPNGERIAFGSLFGTMRIYDTKTKKFSDPIEEHFNEIKTLYYTYDGLNLISASTDGTIRIWNTDTLDCIDTLTGYNDNVLSLKYSPDGKKITTSGLSQIRNWDVQTGELLWTIKDDRVDFTSLNYDPDGSSFVCGYVNTLRQRNLLIYSADSGKIIKYLFGHRESVPFTAYSRDGQRIASVGNGKNDNFIRIWDTKTGICIDSFPTLKPVYAVVFSPEGRHLVTGNEDGIIIFWDLNKRIFVDSLNPQKRLRSLAYGLDSRTLITGHDDGTILIWDTDSHKCLDTLYTNHENDKTKYIKSVLFSPDYKKIISFADDSRVWNAATGICMDSLKWHNEWLSTGDISPDGQYIACGSDDGSIRIWDIGYINARIGITSDSYWSIVDTNTSIHDVYTIDGLTCYPNPASDKLYISYRLDKTGSSELYITNLLGEVVKELPQMIDVGKYTGTVDISDLTPGTYYLVLRSGGEKSMVKFLVVR